MPPTLDRIEAAFLGLVALECCYAAGYLLLRTWWGA